MSKQPTSMVPNTPTTPGLHANNAGHGVQAMTDCQPNWPSDLVYLPRCIYSHSLSPEVLAVLHTAPPSIANSPCTILPASALPPSPNPALDIRLINDSSHPAFGQRGLFAARHLEPGSLICLYTGIVSFQRPGERTEDGRGSDYDLSLCRELIPEGSTSGGDSEVLNTSIDAEKAGNEARFVNDYRGVPPPSRSINATRQRKGSSGVAMRGYEARRAEKSNPNVEFREIWIRQSRQDVKSRLKRGDNPISQVQCKEADMGPWENLSLVGSISACCEDLAFSAASEDIANIGRIWEGSLERCMALFVLSAGRKPGTKRAKGIAKAEELLINYGKGFWKHSIRAEE